MEIIIGNTKRIEVFENINYKTNIEIDFNHINLEQLYKLYGKTDVRKLLNHRTNYYEKNILKVVKGLRLKNGSIANIENTMNRYKLINYKVILENKVLYSGNEKNIDLSFGNSGNKKLIVKIYTKEGKLLNNFEIILSVKKQIKQINKLYSDINNIVEFDDFILVLSVGNSPSTLVVKEIINKNKDKVYEIKIRDEIGNYKILGIGTILNFGSINSNGDLILEDNKKFHFKLITVLSKTRSKESLGKIRVNKLQDNILISNSLYYDIKGIKQPTNSVTIKNFNKSKLLLTKYYNKKPLFYYFISKGSISKDIEVINEKGKNQNIKVLKKDENLRFIYFQPNHGESYFYKKDNRIIPIKYKEITESYYEEIKLINGEIIFNQAKYLDKIILIGNSDEETDITIMTENNKSIKYKNIKKFIKRFSSSYFSITSKHHSIEKKVKKIEFSNKNIKTIYNIFTDYNISDTSINYYKNSNEIVYYAKKVLNKDINTILKNEIKIGKKYALENNKLIEYDDGYIEVKELYFDHFFEDFINTKKEIAHTKNFGLVYNGNHENEKELFNNYCKQFKTVGLRVVNK